MKLKTSNFKFFNFKSFYKQSDYLENKLNLLIKERKYFSIKKKDKEIDESLDSKFINGKNNIEDLFYYNKDEYSMEYNVRIYKDRIDLICGLN